MFTKHFVEGYVHYVTRVNRFVKQTDKEIVNASFEQFLRERNLNIPENYRMNYSTLDGGFKSFAKYDVPQPNIDINAWAMAGEWTLRHFSRFMGGSRVLPLDLVIKESEKTTSPGYPANLHYKNKTEFFNSLSRPIIEDYWEEISRPEPGIVPIWTCSQKIEVRPIEKVNEERIRTFTGSPIEFTMACNRLCLDANEKFYASANKHWAFCGQSKFMQGWDKLYRRLNKHPNAFELDESNYDASLFQLALEGQFLIRWEMLDSEFKTDENYNRLLNIYKAIVYSMVVMDNGDLVQKVTGGPSGSGNTVVDNSMILFRLFAYAWIILAKRENRAISYADFQKHVEAALYGDDNTYTCSDEVVGWFNPSSIQVIWSNIGVTTNTPCLQPRKLEDCRFLSQGFIYDKEAEMWFPLPETDKVLCSLLYGSNVDDIRFHLLRACALRMDSWGNPVCRTVINDYIMWLRNRYADKLHGTVKLPNDVCLTMLEIDNAYKGDDFLFDLYTGNERSSGLRSSGHCFKNSFLQYI